MEEIWCCDGAWLKAQTFIPLLLPGQIGILVLSPTIRLSRVQGKLREPRIGAFLGLSLDPSVVYPRESGVRDRRRLGTEEVVLWEETLLSRLLGAFEAQSRCDSRETLVTVSCLRMSSCPFLAGVG